jgi:hypothetical protein
VCPYRRNPYFDVVVGPAWSRDPENSAGGRVAAGRISHAGQVKGNDADEKGYPGFQVRGWADDTNSLKYYCRATSKRRSIFAQICSNIERRRRKDCIIQAQ